MKVVILHGSSNKFFFYLDRNLVLSNSNFESNFFPILRFSRINPY